ncbi:MAG: hypothetical protein IPG47_01955 [Thermoflexaceae bacterium]|nr:hypothetical protein [Thermoflexaceae bacterium]
MPGNMWDMGPEEDDEQDEDLTLQLTRVSASPTDDPKVFKVHLESTRGTIEGILHPVEGGTGAVICVGGAMGGFDGPADSLYPRLAGLLAPKGVTTLRIEYRQPNNFEECVIDVMAGCSFMQGIGAEDLVLLGHSFGAAVVIKAGELFPRVRGVAAMSPQLHGTRQVQQLGRPLPAHPRDVRFHPRFRGERGHLPARAGSEADRAVCGHGALARPGEGAD